MLMPKLFKHVNCPTNVISAFDKPRIPHKTSMKSLFMSRNGHDKNIILYFYCKCCYSFAFVFPTLIVPVLHTHFSPILIFLPGKMSIYSVFPPEKLIYTEISPPEK